MGYTPPLLPCPPDWERYRFVKGRLVKESGDVMGNVRFRPDDDEELGPFGKMAVALVMLFVILTIAGFLPKAWTVEHDGHKWVRTTHGGITHHPDCPCRAERGAE